MLGDIASGELDVADVLFLVAFIVFVVAAVVRVLVRPVPIADVLLAAGLAALALGWLML